MSKFKVGDKVKTVCNGGYSLTVKTGDTGTVVKVHSNNCVEVDLGYTVLSFFDRELELTPKFNITTQFREFLDKEKGMEQFTKDDLKDGDKIYIADKDIDYPQLPFYVGGEQAIRLDFSKRASHIELSDMYSDFITSQGRKVTKIVRDGTVLFERQPEKRKVTLELTEEQERELRNQLVQ